MLKASCIALLLISFLKFTWDTVPCTVRSIRLFIFRIQNFELLSSLESHWLFTRIYLHICRICRIENYNNLIFRTWIFHLCNKTHRQNILKFLSKINYRFVSINSNWSRYLWVLLCVQHFMRCECRTNHICNWHINSPHCSSIKRLLHALNWNGCCTCKNTFHHFSWTVTLCPSILNASINYL